MGRGRERERERGKVWGEGGFACIWIDNIFVEVVVFFFLIDMRCAAVKCLL